jgi:tetratricopeptide (TPR) repeat protein
MHFGARMLTLSLLVLIFSASAVSNLLLGQRSGQHTLWGDLKIEGAPTDGTYQVILMAGFSELARLTIGAGGRYKFNNISNGDYELVVQFENETIYRNRFHLSHPLPTDVKQDIVLEARASNGGTNTKTPAIVSANLRYDRSARNQALYDQALAASKKNETGQAIVLLRQVVADDANDFVAWAELGTFYFKQNSLPESEDAYLRALQIKPDFALALLNLGKLALVQKKYDAAVDVLTRAVAAAPQSADAQQYLGEAYLGLKKGSKAIGPLNGALRLDPKGKADIHLRLAALYNGAGMKDKAAAEYEQFLIKRPDSPGKAKLEEYIKQNKKP